MASLTDSESQSDNADYGFSPPYQANLYPDDTDQRPAFRGTHSASSGSESDPHISHPSAAPCEQVYSPMKKRTYSIDTSSDLDESHTSFEEPYRKRPRRSVDSSSDKDDPPHIGFGSSGLGSSGLQGNSLAQEFLLPPQATQGSGYSDKAKNYMKKFGYVEGQGLGARGQGIVEPVESSTQKGRRGLGHEIKGFEQSNVGWDTSKEHVSSQESVDWLPSCTESIPDYSELLSWYSIGKEKMSIDDETEFVSHKTLTDVLNSKSVFDNLEGYEMRKARTKSNPYETIKGAFFLNRAAMKMANMDAVLGFMFTNPRHNDGTPMLGKNDILYFADVCAGPGGFSEYVLWRKQTDVKGFGFTLKGDCDFKLVDFYAAPQEFFEPHYGQNDDGDIYSPENQISFRTFVLDHTDNKGVHFMMADGGFSVEGQENLQEICSKRLYLCQFTVALSILRTGGSFVCKLFDLFTPFSVGLVYLMYKAFHRVSVYKPVTSRPANSERYIVCQGLREDSDAIYRYMFELNCKLEQFAKNGRKEDLREVVPLEMIKEDQGFYRYICQSNETIGHAQIISLIKIQTFAKNPKLIDDRQADVRDECLRIWQVPNESRVAPKRGLEEARQRFKRLMGVSEYGYLQTQRGEIKREALAKDLPSIYDYRCIMCGAERRQVLLSLGSSYVYELTPKNNWEKVSFVEFDANIKIPLRLELPANTLVEVEYVKEYRGEGRGQRNIVCVHVIDGMFIANKDIRQLHYTERMSSLQRFVKAINRSTRPELTTFKVKEIFRCENLEQIFNRLAFKEMKKNRHVPRVCFTSDDGQGAQQDTYYVPTAIMFISITADPWTMAFSRSQRRKYLFNRSTGVSMFDSNAESIANHRESRRKSVIWSWVQGVKYFDGQQDYDRKMLSKDYLLDYIKNKS